MPDDVLVLTKPIEAFNGKRIKVDGRIIQIEPTKVDSGTAEEYLEEKKGPLPDVWIPASSVWEGLLRASGSGILPAESRSLFTSPQVFAVWEPLASSIGPTLSWDDIHRFAKEPGAWRAVAGDSSDEFRLAHLNPERSTSGLTAAISEFSYAVQHPEEVAIRDIENGSEVVGEIESSIVHYGPTSGDMLEQFACFGPSYADVIYVQETSLHRFNEGGYESEECHEDWPPLVKRVPSDIQFSADYPCIPILQDNRTATQAADEFCQWLSSRLETDPLHLKEYSFKPSADRLPSGTTLTPFPDGKVLQEIQLEWRKHRKLAEVMIAVDRSESMATQLDQIEVELNACLQEFVDSDGVGLVSFGDDSEVHVSLGPFDRTHDPILDAIEELNPRGATAIIDGISVAVDQISRVRDEDRIAAVVVITDGDQEGDPSRTALRDLVDVLRRFDPPIRVFIVESGGRVNAATRRAVVEASQGRVFNVEDTDKDPLGLVSPVAQVCGEVFSYF